MARSVGTHKRPRVAIIGAGLSGVAVAAALLERGRRAPDVVLIERSKKFARGLAYDTSAPAHILNTRAARMSARESTPEDFAAWLSKRGVDDAPHAFALRSQYGRYLEHVLARAARRAFPSRLKRVRAEALSCAGQDGDWSIALCKGAVVNADAVVLALGNGPAPPPAAFAHAQVISAFDADALARIPSRADVLLLGTGLTMADAALSLSRRPRKGVIYALSRRGLAPRAHAEGHGQAGARLNPPAQLSAALHAFRLAAKHEPWQFVMDRARLEAPEFWRRLSLQQQQRFLRHLRPWWDVHRHRAAPQVVAQLDELRDAGALRVLAGKVVSVTPNGRATEVIYHQRGAHARHRLEVGRIVNCTGVDLDFTKPRDGLIGQVLQAGLARTPANGLGFDVDEACRVIAASGAAHQSLYALGPITQGAFWESTAAPEIRAHAAAIANALTLV